MNHNLKKLKIAQVGVGNFGAYRRARLRETGLFELVATFDLDGAAMAAAQNEDGATPTASYEELIQTPDIEAVVVATGAKFHAEHAVAAMEQGLHVFIEKPLCATPQELEMLLAAHRKNDVIVGVGHIDHKYDPVALATRNLVKSGELGTIAAFEHTTAHRGGFDIRPGDWRGDELKNPGGMLPALLL